MLWNWGNSSAVKALPSLEEDAREINSNQTVAHNYLLL